MSKLSVFERSHPNIFHALGFVIQELALATGVSPATKAIINETTAVLQSMPVLPVHEEVVADVLAQVPVPVVPVVDHAAIVAEVVKQVPAPIVDTTSDAFQRAVNEAVAKAVAAYIEAHPVKA